MNVTKPSQDDDKQSTDRRAVRAFQSIPPFKSSAYWRGGWMQTMSIKFLESDLSPETRSDCEAISVPDDHTPPDQLSGYYFPATTKDRHKPLVVAFHGMGGHALSGYMCSIADRLNGAGFDVLLWNHRGAGRSAATCTHLHHPGYTEDVHRLLQYLCDERPSWSENGLACVAFSLGANVLLKYLAETGSDSQLDFGVSVSAPLDMAITSRNLRTGMNRVFDRYLLRKQRDEVLRDAAELSNEEKTRISAADSVWQLDDQFTAKRFGYSGAPEFYRDNSAVHTLGQIRRPTLLLHAEDDPVVDRDVFDQVEWEKNEFLYPAMVKSGGHTGFLDHKGQRWHEHVAIAFLDAMTS